MKTAWQFVVVGLVFVGCQAGPGEVFTIPAAPTSTVGEEVTLPEGTEPTLATKVDVPNPEPIDGMILRIHAGGQLVVPLTALRKQLQQDLTLELWVWLEEDGDQLIMATSNSSLRLLLHQGRLCGEVATIRLHGPVVKRHEWYHVALIVEGEQARLHVNGAFQAREFLPSPRWERPRGALIMGHFPTNMPSFVGQVDNLRLVADVVYTKLYFPTSHHLIPVDDALFGFDFEQEAPGGVIPDVAGNDNHARLYGKASVGPGQI